MTTEAKYKFIAVNSEGKRVNINLPHAATTANTTKMETLLNAYGDAADSNLTMVQIDHIKTETTSVTAD